MTERWQTRTVAALLPWVFFWRRGACYRFCDICGRRCWLKRNALITGKLFHGVGVDHVHRKCLLRQGGGR